MEAIVDYHRSSEKKADIITLEAIKYSSRPLPPMLLLMHCAESFLTTG